jgi:SWIM zinc finger
MATVTVAQPAYAVPDETRTRVARGLKLFREHGEEIENLGRGRYCVPGCSGGSYEVSLGILGDEESCTCPDFERRQASCKHIFAADLYRAKIQRPAGRRRSERAISAGAKTSST